MLILGLDTATPAVTVALHDGARPLAQMVTVDAHRHAELLMPSISAVIDEAGVTRADLTGIAVGAGPGPFTGLRVGLVTARVLGLALGIPVYGACTLDVIAADVEAAEGFGRGGYGGSSPREIEKDAPGKMANSAIGRGFLVASDARRREVYWAAYDSGGRRLGEPAVTVPAAVPAGGRPVAGEGAVLYPDLLPGATGPVYPAAASLCRLVADALKAGEEDRLLPPDPLYLRRPDAREPGAPKRVTETAAPKRAPR
ncbi:MAG: tRNA (adenosine(37)-N6)-threonylcarbamoyltransferase complex dimerization subunit type 1 TsaB [Streptosporangiales bacterium]|nr:tRNA (adenosine(37)-N6)-threonylcarbamoyltransferase complex dimerization subunit type 1 TsaB [Streptosporangiales bacterium]